MTAPTMCAHSGCLPADPAWERAHPPVLWFPSSSRSGRWRLSAHSLLPGGSTSAATPSLPEWPCPSHKRAVPSRKANSAVHWSRTHSAIVRGTARCPGRSASASLAFIMATLGLAVSGGIAFRRFLRVSRASDHGRVAARRLSRQAQARVGSWLPTGSTTGTTLHGTRDCTSTCTKICAG